MRHPATALSRVTIALCALVLFPAQASADAAPDPDEAVDQITQLNRDAITAYQAKKFDEARKLLKQALDLATAAGLDKHAIKGPHAHPLRGRHHRRVQSARSRHQAVPQGDRDPVRHRADQVADNAGITGGFRGGEEGRRAAARSIAAAATTRAGRQGASAQAARIDGHRADTRAGRGREAGERDLEPSKSPTSWSSKS